MASKARAGRKSRNYSIVPAASRQTHSHEERREIVDRLCELLTQPTSLADILALEWCPSLRTLDKWFEDAPDLRAMFETAKTLRAEVLVETMMVEVGKPSSNFLHLGDKRLRVEVAKYMINARLPQYARGADPGAFESGPLQIVYRYEVPKPIERDDDAGLEAETEVDNGSEAPTPPGSEEGRP